MPDYYSGLTPDSFFPLRAQQIYNPQNYDANLPTYDIAQRLKELYQPQSRITDLYAQALQNIPQREKPGKLQNIFALMAGLGAGAGPAAYENGAAVGFRGNPKAALEVTDLVRNKPFYEKLGDWQTRTGALEKGTELENRSNINQRTLANEIIGREIQDRGLAERTRHQLETEQLAARRNEQIHEVAVAKLQAKVDESEKKLELANQRLQADVNNRDAINAWHNASLEALNARHALDVAQRDRQLEEQKRLHDTMKTKWETEAKDREERLKQYEKQLGINQQKADKTTGAQASTTTTETKDASGKVTGTKVVTKGPVVKPEEKKVGDIKVFPNGNKGRWDGKGWVMVK